MKIQDAKAIVKELAGKRYHSVAYDMSGCDKLGPGYEKTECNVYIEKVGSFTAPTFQLAITRLKTAMDIEDAAPEEPQDIDDQPQAAAN